MVDKETAQETTPKVKERKRSLRPRKSEEKSPEPVHEAKEAENERESPAQEEHVQEDSISMPAVPDQITGMVGREKLQEIMSGLRKLDRITNDDGEEVAFEGSAKEAFLKDVEGAYPIFGAALSSLYETGKYLYEVRERQKQNHLWMKYQEISGQSTSFINNYIRVYESVRERLPDFSHLGISKLEVVARWKEPVAYIEANQAFLETASFKEVRQKVRTDKEKGVKHRSKRKETYEDVGSFRLKLTSNGRSLTISNLNKELQKELMDVLKAHLSHRK
jgi:hypothetical protein